jgi:hypothetical protein
MLPSHQVDGTPVDEGENPRRGLPPSRIVCPGLPPDTDKRVLDRVFGKRGVVQNAEREAVRSLAVTVVKGAEGILITVRARRDSRVEAFTLW